LEKKVKYILGGVVLRLETLPICFGIAGKRLEWGVLRCTQGLEGGANRQDDEGSKNWCKSADIRLIDIL